MFRYSICYAFLLQSISLYLFNCVNGAPLSSSPPSPSSTSPSSSSNISHDDLEVSYKNQHNVERMEERDTKASNNDIIGIDFNPLSSRFGEATKRWGLGNIESLDWFTSNLRLNYNLTVDSAYMSINPVGENIFPGFEGRPSIKNMIKDLKEAEKNEEKDRWVTLGITSSSSQLSGNNYQEKRFFSNDNELMEQERDELEMSLPSVESYLQAKQEEKKKLGLEKEQQQMRKFSSSSSNNNFVSSSSLSFKTDSYSPRSNLRPLISTSPSTTTIAATSQITEKEEIIEKNESEEIIDKKEKESEFRALNVYGTDGRKFFSSRSYPDRTVGKLVFPSAYFCTGTLISSDLVLTAAHCFFSYGSQVDGNNMYKSEFKVAYERNVSSGKYSSPYTSTWSTLWFGTKVPEMYRDQDWAIIKLDNPIGDYQGFIGVDPTVLKTELPLKHSFTLIGYSEDGFSNTAGKDSACSLESFSQNVYFHNCDCEAGASGGAIIDKGRNVAVAINTAHIKPFNDQVLKYSDFNPDFPNIGVPVKSFYPTLQMIFTNENI